MKKILVILALLFFLIVPSSYADEKKSQSEITFTEDYIEDTVGSSDLKSSNNENQGILPKTNELEKDFSWVGFILVGIVLYFFKIKRDKSVMK